MGVFLVQDDARRRSAALLLQLLKLRGGSQQTDDIGFVLKRARVGLYEAMMDCDLADLIELVFGDADFSKSAG
jgi:hypothetical protein